MAVRSSGNSVKAKIFLDTPLQYVAGASHIDLVDLYELPQSPHQYFWRTLKAINEVLEEIRLPETSEEWYQLNNDWNNKMIEKFAVCYFPGTTLAIDGIVLETQEPLDEEVKDNVSSNFSRKSDLVLLVYVL